MSNMENNRFSLILEWPCRKGQNFGGIRRFSSPEFAILIPPGMVGSGAPQGLNPKWDSDLGKGPR